jgi:hypothetical protein
MWGEGWGGVCQHQKGCQIWRKDSLEVIDLVEELEREKDKRGAEGEILPP